MKIKFKVTNSSSTSFIMMWPSGGKLKLFDKLRKEKCFDIYYEGYRCNTEEVINEIKDNWKEIRIDIDSEIEYITKHNRKLENNSFYKENPKFLQPEKDFLEVLKESRKKGFKEMIKIDFGDNHGHCAKINVRYAMDYEGRYVSIKNEDLIIFTRQNR